MNWIILLLALIPPPTCSKATVRDRQGRIVQSVTVAPAKPVLTLRDTSGRITGTVTIKGSTAVVRDARGRIK